MGLDSPLFFRLFDVDSKAAHSMLHGRLAQDGMCPGAVLAVAGGRVCRCCFLVLRELPLCERIRSQWSWMSQFVTRRQRNVDLRRVASFAFPRVSLGKSSLFLVVARSMQRFTDSTSLQTMLTDCSLLLK